MCGPVPSIFCLAYIQAFLLDLDFFDRHFQPGAHLWTYAEHKALRVPGDKGYGKAKEKWKEELEKI